MIDNVLCFWREILIDKDIGGFSSAHPWHVFCECDLLCDSDIHYQVWFCLPFHISLPSQRPPPYASTKSRVICIHTDLNQSQFSMAFIFFSSSYALCMVWVLLPFPASNISPFPGRPLFIYSLGL